MKVLQFIQQQFKPANALEAAIGKYNRIRNPFQWGAICHAPFRSMYLGQGGIVSACCYNRSHPLGFWPQQSLLQIWEGAKANELREELSAYRLKKGCLYCEAQLLAHNFKGLKAAQFDELHSNRALLPTSIEFELDNKCNLACVMCNEDLSSVIAAKKGLPTHKSPYDDRLLTELETFIPYLEDAKFYGGEPFMIKIYYDIWDRIISLNSSCRISIQTNANIYNSRVEKILRHGNLHFNISIDSLKKDNYEKIRSGADFDVVKSNIEIFYSYSQRNKTFFGISACMMQQNAYEAPDFIRYCNSLDVPIYFHTVFTPKECALHQLPKEELLHLKDHLERQQFDVKTSIQKANVKHYSDFIEQVDFWIKQDYSALRIAHDQPAVSLEQLHERIDKAAAAVYGLELGSIKAEKFKQNLSAFLDKESEEMRNTLLMRMRHEDLSAFIHKFIDMGVQDITRALHNNE